MEPNKNINSKLSLSAYKKKYRNRNSKLLKFSKKEVEQFDKENNNKEEKGFLLKGRKWALIKDTYYEIPKAPSLTWFRNLSSAAQIATCALLGGGVATAVVVPTTLSIINKPVTPEPVPPGPGPTPVTKKIQLSTETLTIKEGKVAPISAQIIESNENNMIQWSYKGDTESISLSSTQSNSGSKITITANKPGTVELYAAASGIDPVKCDITVSENAATDLVLSAETMTLANQAKGTITSIGTPVGASITWESLDPEKVEILESNNDKCTFIGHETTTDPVTIKATSGTITKTCAVTVNAPTQEQNLCYVKFNAGECSDAILPNNTPVTKGATMDKPSPDPTSTTKKFDCWYLNNEKFEFDESGKSKKIVDTDIELTAHWTENKATVKFISNGEEISSSECLVGSLVNPPEKDPEYQGHIFGGWAEDEEGETLYDFTEPVPAEGLTLYAVWSANEIHTVKYINDDDTVYSTLEFEDGKCAPVPTDEPTSSNEDYDFIGWYTAKTGGEKYNFSTIPTGDFELYARYQEVISDFEITHACNHNLDCDSDLPAFSASKSAYNVSKVSNAGNITWSVDDTTKIKSIDDGIPEIEKTGTAVAGKAMVTASKQYSSCKIEKTYEVEIGSFDKLDTEQLKEGIAVARNKNITGRVIIPSRYWNGTDWIPISKIGDNGFEGCKDIDIYIPVPTIAIGEGAFKDVDGLGLDFADKSNTWPFGGEELDPSKTEDLAKIIENLKKGTESEKTPCIDGLTFEPASVSSDKGYRVKVSTEYKNKFGKKDLLIPQWYDEESGGTVYVEGKSKPVVEIANEGFTGEEIETITLQSNLSTIGNNAFENCDNLKEIFFSKEFNNLEKHPLPEGYQDFYINDYAFKNCPSLKEISMPNYLHYIGKESFASDSGIEKVNFPASDSIESGGDGIFKNCTNLTTVTLNNTYIAGIPDETFYGCTALKEITIPRSTQMIGESVFAKSGLLSANFEDENSNWFFYNESKDPEVLLYAEYSNKVKAEKLVEFHESERDTYLYIMSLSDKMFDYEPVKKDDVIIAYQIKSLKDTESDIAQLSIPSTYNNLPVIGIMSTAFTGSTASSRIQSVTIPKTITTIGEGAFKGLSNLRNIYFATDSVITDIPANFASSCNSLQYVYLPDSVSFIGASAFIGSNTSNLKIDVGLNKDTKWKYCDANKNKIIKLSTSWSFYCKNHKAGWFDVSNVSVICSTWTSDYCFMKIS